MGIGTGEVEVPPCLIGMDMPAMGFFALLAVAFLPTAFFVAALFPPAFFTGLFLTADFFGIGMVIPGMRICAVRGADMLASASALATLSFRN